MNNKCNQLAQEITQLRNQLAKRMQDLQHDKLKLPKQGKNSVAGHIQQYGDKSRRLRRLLNQWDSNGCGNGGKGIPEDAWKYASSKNHQGFINRKEVVVIAGAFGIGALIVAACFSAPVAGPVLASIAIMINQ